MKKGSGKERGREGRQGCMSCMRTRQSNAKHCGTPEAEDARLTAKSWWATFAFRRRASVSEETLLLVVSEGPLPDGVNTVSLSVCTLRVSLQSGTLQHPQLLELYRCKATDGKLKSCQCGALTASLAGCAWQPVQLFQPLNQSARYSQIK